MLGRFWSLYLLALAAFAGAVPASAQPSDEVAAASRSVVRVVVVAVSRGAVVGFGHGSGFAIDGRRIVTNAHVVAPAARYPDNVVIGIVPSQGSRSYSARLVAIDPTRDLALLEMREGSVPAASLYMGPLPGGTDVVALGYPGNVDLATAQSAEGYITPQAPTRSEGNFSNDRQVKGAHALLHTAGIARGNIGGPLLDECGRVLGVNTFITRADEGDASFGFAIGNTELAAFLREVEQGFTAVSTPCVRGTAAPQPRAASPGNAQERLAGQWAQQRALAEAVRGNEDAREDRLAIALLLGGLGIVAFAGAGLLLWKDRMRAATILAAAGLCLALTAAAAFLTRPDRSEPFEAAAEAGP